MEHLSSLSLLLGLAELNDLSIKNKKYRQSVS